MCSNLPWPVWTPKARQALHTIAAFRMPASYDTLAALFVTDAVPKEP